MDDIGVQSASNEGFALSVYKTLMPPCTRAIRSRNCSTAGV